MIAVYKREVGSYFKGILGYLFTAFILIFAGIYCMVYNLSGYYANFEYALSGVSFIYLIAVPVLTMRAMAEERRQKTDQLLYSLPVRLSSVVLGKYLALVTVLAVPVAVMCLYPLVLSLYGTVSFSTAYCGILGFFLLGATLLSIGLFISSMTESQVASAVITLVTMLLLYYMSALSSYVSDTAVASLIALCVAALVFGVILWLLTKNPIISAAVFILLAGGMIIYYFAVDSTVFAGAFANVMNALSVFDRFDPFMDGLLDLNNVVYDLSVIGVALFLSVQAMEKRRWNE